MVSPVSAANCELLRERERDYKEYVMHMNPTHLLQDKHGQINVLYIEYGVSSVCSLSSFFCTWGTLCSRRVWDDQ